MEPQFITPKRAEELLASMPTVQRNEKKQAARRYEYTMAKGLWRDDYSAPIVISEDGKMLDGQHRCLACVRSGVGFWAWVNYGVPEDAYSAIDAGVARIVADFLDCKNKSQVASIGNLMFEFVVSKGKNPAVGAGSHSARHYTDIPTSERVKFCYLNMEKLEPCAADAKKKAKSVDNVFNATQLGTIRFICGAKDEQKAAEWFEQLSRYTPAVVDAKAAIDKNDGRSRSERRSSEELKKEANARLLLDFDNFANGRSVSFTARSRSRVESEYSGLDYSDWKLPSTFTSQDSKCS